MREPVGRLTFRTTITSPAGQMSALALTPHLRLAAQSHIARMMIGAQW
jgi:hypothetical protein